MNTIIPIPRSQVTVRPGTLTDLPFIDALQKKQSKQVGWMPNATLEGKIKLGHVIVAQDDQNAPLGYCIGNDKYMKHEDVGIIYQLNVAPGTRRKLVGATLIQALFARSAYGCRLFCCWCAQDIEANHFWEALGFIPLAFRTGSRGKGCRPQARVHIFWQRRIREGDTTTPYWFPSQTSAGSIREDRLVLPIPPGTHWSDAKPLILPGVGPAKERAQLEGPVAVRPRQKMIEPPKIARLGGVSFTPPKPPKAEKRKPEKKPKLKNDPAHVAAARELRDRYLEQFNSGVLADGSNVLPSGKYDVCRLIDAGVRPMPMLEQAA